jgi:hypothetical protein
LVGVVSSWSLTEVGAMVEVYYCISSSAVD